jgi:hypothetical protein
MGGAEAFSRCLVRLSEALPAIDHDFVTALE